MNHLLQPGDFHIFPFDNKKYVFLSGSQQILEISNPTQILFCFDPARQKKRDAPFGSQKRNSQHA
ncbi:hypothetical protein [Bacteroides rodentium]